MSHIYRPTEIESYIRCGLKHHYEVMLDKKPSYHNWPKVRGTIIHETIFHGLEFFDEAWKAAIRECGDVPILASEEAMQKDRPMMIEQVANILHYIGRQGIDIIDKEVNLKWEVGPYKFQGTVDAFCVMPDTPEDMVEIIDYKSGVKWAKPALDRKIQFGLYWYGAKQNELNVNRMFWVHTKDFNLYKTTGKKARKGEMKGQGFYPIEIKESDMPVLKEWVMGACWAMEHDVKLPAEGGPNSPCNNCEFGEQCPKYETGLIETHGLDVSLKRQEEMEAKFMEGDSNG